MLYHEMGDQEAAAQHLLKSRELGEQSTLPDWPYRLCLAQAQLKEAGGDLEAALDLLHEAKRLYVRIPSPDIRPIEALKARVYVKQGRLPNALAWVHERGLSVDDELSYLREFEHITLAGVLLARYKREREERHIQEAMGLLERLLKAAEGGGRTGSVIEILVLQALAHQAEGDLHLALAPLERALTLAEPEGYVRIFGDVGPPMAELLSRLKDEGGRMKEYIHKLLTTFGQQKDVHPVGSAQDESSSLRLRSGQALSPQPLVDPLSERECEVLKLLTTELSGPEIARELMVSMNTIRTHNKNIYSKLGVNSRRDAVKQAKELKLI
jgi:LuxR family maltose regulon positive regulatory protein